MIFGQSHKHLRRSLGVTHVWNFRLISKVSHIVDLSWCVELTELIEAVVEVVLAVSGRFGVILCVTSAVSSSSIITKPSIIARLSKIYREWFFSKADPVIGISQETMLYEHCFGVVVVEWAFGVANSEHVEFVTIWSRDFMGFTFQVLLFDKHAECQVVWDGSSPVRDALGFILQNGEGWFSFLLEETHVIFIQGLELLQQIYIMMHKRHWTLSYCLKLRPTTSTRHGGSQIHPARHYGRAPLW